MLSAELKLFKLFAFVLLFALTGCQILPNVAAPATLKLLPPAQGPAPVVLKQVVTLEAKGKQRQFLVVTKLRPELLEMVALMPTGQRLMTLSYDGQRVQQQQLTSVALPGEDILAILQFSLWPMDSLKQHYLQQNGWQINDSYTKRQLLKDSQLLLEVFYQTADKQQLLVENYMSNYRVLIKTLESKAL